MGHFVSMGRRMLGAVGSVGSQETLACRFFETADLVRVWVTFNRSKARAFQAQVNP